jgi:dienelactone hydrolase
VPFDTKIISQTEQSGVIVTELSYATHDPSFATNMGGRTVATLVSPTGKGPFAGILYLYGYNANPTGSSEYLSEAIMMASHGAISLLPKDIFPAMFAPTGTQADRSMIIGQVIELRRAFDFLLAQPTVDPKRLGYVGQDFGGLYGGVLAGVDKRAKAYVLIGGYPSFAKMIAGYAYASSSSSDQYLSYVKDIDPINYVQKAAPASLFFQFGKNDTFATESLANQYYAAASQPRKIAWYDDDHAMRTDPVSKARQAWLIEQLKITP